MLHVVVLLCAFSLYASLCKNLTHHNGLATVHELIVTLLIAFALPLFFYLRLNTSQMEMFYMLNYLWSKYHSAVHLH